jgi:hypothetical protein
MTLACYICGHPMSEHGELTPPDLAPFYLCRVCDPPKADDEGDVDGYDLVDLCCGCTKEATA